MAKKQVRRPKRKITAPKKCAFCEAGKEPSFLDAETLRNYLSDRAKVIGRVRSGLCAKHQRRMTVEVKHARHLALLPFTPHHR